MTQTEIVGEAIVKANNTPVQPVPPMTATAASNVTASLYVGELLPEVTEAILFEFFSSIGPISSIRVCRDAITRRSLGYAYVNFHQASDCEKALETLNFTEIKGQPCRLMWSQRDPSVRRSGVGNIYIKNLDKEIDNKSLHDTFSVFGNILSCKVVLNEKGESKGFGFVHFETREAAEEAIRRVNGMLLNGTKVFVGFHINRKERFSLFEEQRNNFTNVFIKNLDESIDEAQLKKIFEAYGEIQSASIQRDESGKSRGFGFVNFTRTEDAVNAVAKLNESEIKEKKIYAGRAQKRFERQEELRRQFEALKLEQISKFHGVNLYVKNIDEIITEEVLKSEFSPFGTITSIKIMADEKGVSRGFGFICYSEPEEAARALNEMNGRMLNGKPLYVSLAQRKEERRAQLESQFAQRAHQMRMQAMAAAAAASGMGIYQQGPLFYPAVAGGSSGVPIPGRFPSGVRPPFVGGVAGPMMQHHPSGGMMRPMRPIRSFRQQPMMPHPNSGNATFQRRPPMNAQFSTGHHSGMMPASSQRFVRAPFPEMRGSNLTMATLSALPRDQQKRLLGESIYPLVFTIDREQASKITGMLLEMDNSELLHLIESDSALSAKVTEAQDVLRAHKAATSVNVSSTTVA